MLITRSDRSKSAMWLWTIDRWLFMSYLALIVLGAIFMMAASPMIADNLSLYHNYFTIKHITFLTISFFLVLLFSNFNQKDLKLFSIMFFLLFFILLCMTFFIGETSKGAQRWFNIMGQKFQPSEFLKPFFIILNAWLIDLSNKKKEFHGMIWSSIILSIIIFLLLLQPDLGMTIIFVSVWCVQLFLSGISIKIVLALIFLIPLIMFFAYYNFDHVYYRINSFLDGTSFQNAQAIKSFQNGSYFGKGIGEGYFKNYLPDAHTDFIFAVIAEEFGIILCSFIIILYCIIIFRSIYIASYNKSLFSILSISGLAFLFAFQSIIHISSNIGIIPTKGVTLPFISYGGSSTISSAIIIGFLLSLTRKQINIRNFSNDLENQTDVNG